MLPMTLSSFILALAHAAVKQAHANAGPGAQTNGFWYACTEARCDLSRAMDVAEGRWDS